MAFPAPMRSTPSCITSITRSSNPAVQVSSHSCSSVCPTRRHCVTSKSASPLTVVVDAPSSMSWRSLISTVTLFHPPTTDRPDRAAMSPDSTRAPFTDAEQAYYNQLDEDVTAGRIPAATAHASATPTSTPSSVAAQASDSPTPPAADAPRAARSAYPSTPTRLLTPTSRSTALPPVPSFVMPLRLIFPMRIRQPHDDRSEPWTHCCPVVMPRIHDQAPVAGGDEGSEVVPRTGFEPATFCSGGRRSIH